MDLSMWERISAKLSFSSLGKPALIGLAALLVMVAAFAGNSIIDAATAKTIDVVHDDVSAQSESGTAAIEEGASQEASSASREAASEPQGADAQGAEAAMDSREPKTAFVHVTGAVKSPGLVEVPAGSRLADAVKAAGNFTDDAVPESVNLARVVTDGEQVHVAREGEEEADYARASDAGAQSPEGQDVQSTPVETGPVSDGGSLLNINTASESELETLPGIGPSTAAKIVAEREANGSFASAEDLTRVSGIGEKKLEAIIDLICV